MWQRTVGAGRERTSRTRHLGLVAGRAERLAPDHHNAARRVNSRTRQLRLRHEGRGEAASRGNHAYGAVSMTSVMWRGAGRGSCSCQASVAHPKQRTTESMAACFDLPHSAVHAETIELTDGQHTTACRDLASAAGAAGACERAGRSAARYTHIYARGGAAEGARRIEGQRAYGRIWQTLWPKAPSRASLIGFLPFWEVF